VSEQGANRAEHTAPLEPGLTGGEDRGDIPAADQTAYISTRGRGYKRIAERGPLLGLETRSVSAWFGTHKVLERVNLTMGAGEVTALIGPSGCGKSTYLRILNRMHEMVRGAAMAGEVLLGGEDIYHPSQRAQQVRKRIGMVFQRPNPFPAMSVYENVASGLKLAGIKVRNRDEIVELSLRRAGLWNEMRRRLRTPGGALSGGQQQRLCIARSLAVAPDVLLMDEPCSALDPTSTRRIEETIRELRGEVTVVIVTHNMEQAQRVSDRCAFFLASENTPGHIVEAGLTPEVFDDPKDPRTADYVHGQFG
jgi:phosphate transport system ATP-binding protein